MRKGMVEFFSYFQIHYIQIPKVNSIRFLKPLIFFIVLLLPQVTSSCAIVFFELNSAYLTYTLQSITPIILKCSLHYSAVCTTPQLRIPYLVYTPCRASPRSSSHVHYTSAVCTTPPGLPRLHPTSRQII